MKNYYYFILIITSIFLNACGTKGPLYFPEEKYPQSELKIEPLINKQTESKKA